MTGAVSAPWPLLPALVTAPPDGCAGLPVAPCGGLASVVAVAVGCSGVAVKATVGCAVLVLVAVSGGVEAGVSVASAVGESFGGGGLLGVGVTCLRLIGGSSAVGVTLLSEVAVGCAVFVAAWVVPSAIGVAAPVGCVPAGTVACGGFWLTPTLHTMTWPDEAVKRVP